MNFFLKCLTSAIFILKKTVNVELIYMTWLIELWIHRELDVKKLMRPNSFEKNLQKKILK